MRGALSWWPGVVGVRSGCSLAGRGLGGASALPPSLVGFGLGCLLGVFRGFFVFCCSVVSFPLVGLGVAPASGLVSGRAARRLRRRWPFRAGVGLSSAAGLVRLPLSCLGSARLCVGCGWVVAALGSFVLGGSLVGPPVGGFHVGFSFGRWLRRWRRFICSFRCASGRGPCPVRVRLRARAGFVRRSLGGGGAVCVGSWGCGVHWVSVFARLVCAAGRWLRRLGLRGVGPARLRGVSGFGLPAGPRAGCFMAGRLRVRHLGYCGVGRGVGVACGRFSVRVFSVAVMGCGLVGHRLRPLGWRLPAASSAATIIFLVRHLRFWCVSGILTLVIG